MSDQRTVTCAVPAGSKEADFPPAFPGSDEASEMGCTCPAHQPWPNYLVFNVGCPIHELVRAKN